MAGFQVAVDEVRLMASRWHTQAADLEVAASAVPGSSCQASAAALHAGHVEIASAAAALLARMQATADMVAAAVNHYAVNEDRSAAELTAVADPVPGG